jgi:DNA polymerase alpha subunit B
MDQIQSEFADLDLEITDEDVLAELAVLCQRYSIDAEKISCEYFSFTSNTKHTASSKLLTGQPPTMESLVPFENEKLKTLKPAGSRRPLDPIEGASNLPDVPELSTEAGTPTRLQTKRHGTPDNHMAKRLVTAMGTPGVAGSFTPTSSPVTVARKFTERTNRGEVVLRHQAELSGDWDTNTKAQVVLPTDHLTKPYKFMYERLRDRAAVLDETICKVGEKLVQGLGKEIDGLLDPTSTITEAGLVVGRVQCDGEGRLNSNSVVLQGAMDTSGGAVVPVDLTHVSQFSLFPGQVVAMDCTNPNGSRLVARTVHPGQVCGPQEVASLPREEVLSILVACGPFTTSDSVGLEPLDDFLTVVKTEKPSLAILLGPFLDVRNSHIVESDQNFETQWHNVLARIAEQTAGLDTEVVLVSSGRDATALPVYPQPPLQSTDPATAAVMRSNIHSVADPSTVTVSGVTIGLSSTDILFHLGKEEISFPPRAGDRMSRLTSHLLTQGSYYPLHPPSEDVNVDYEQLELRAALDRVPHLLLLPSDLSHFVREVEGCTVVNPGRVTKGPGPGTFSRLKVKRQEGEGLHTKVEIVRI